MRKYREFEAAAHEMANTARAIAMRYFRRELTLAEKSNGTPVTVADQEIERALRAIIARRFPNHGVLGEEEGADRVENELVWIIDPIDGTKAFATGKPLFGTLIALAIDGRPVLGLIDQPFTKERWFGCNGTISTHNSKKIWVAKECPLQQARAYTAAPEMFVDTDAAAFALLRKATKWMLYGCDCYAYGLLAMGQVDLVVERDLEPHDYCALDPVIRNAGGHISDWNGKPLTINSNGTVVAASSRGLAASAMEILACGFR